MGLKEVVVAFPYTLESQERPEAGSLWSFLRPSSIAAVPRETCPLPAASSGSKQLQGRVQYRKRARTRRRNRLT